MARAPASGQQTNPQAPSLAQATVAPPVQPSAASAGPNANPLNLFPQVCDVNVPLIFFISLAWNLVFEAFIIMLTIIFGRHYLLIYVVLINCHYEKCQLDFLEMTMS